MSVYDRTNNIVGEVALIQKNVDDIKQTQIIGNDNLVIGVYYGNSNTSNISSGSTALYKLTFTFDTPSTNYVLCRYRFGGINLTSFNANFYADPATVNDLTQKSWYFSITVFTNVTSFAISCNMNCSSSGTTTVTRIS